MADRMQTLARVGTAAGLVTISNAARLLQVSGDTIGTQEIRLILIQSGIPTFRDGRTTTRYLEASGLRRLSALTEEFRRKRRDYLRNMTVHAAFNPPQGDADGK